MSTSIRSISNTNKEEQCGNTGFQFFSGFCLSVVRYFLPLDAQVKMNEMQSWVSSLSESKRNFNLKQRLHRLHQAIVQIAQDARNSAKVYIATRKVNARMIVGIFLVGCCAPLADIFYTWDWLEQFHYFNHDTKIKGWYYDNFFYLFLCLGPYLDKLFTVLGLYYAFVDAEYKKSYIVTIPVMLAVAKIMWLMQVSNDIEFHSTPTVAYYGYAFIMASMLWFMTDYLAWRKYHRADAFDCRLDTVINGYKANVVSAEQAMRDIMITRQEMKAKNY